MELGPLRVRVGTGWTFAGLPGKEDDEGEEVAGDDTPDPDEVASDADEAVTVEREGDVTAGPTTEEREDETPRPHIPPVEQYSKPSSEVQVISCEGHAT